jgi:integrase
MYIKIILDTRNRNKDGKHPVKLRFTSGTRAVYVAMSMFALPEEWDENTYFSLNNKATRDKNKRNNTLLLKELERAEDLLFDLNKKGMYNVPPMRFKEMFLVGTKQTPSFLTYFEEFRNKKSGRTIEVYTNTLRKLQKYISTTLFFEDITIEWLQGYEQWLKKRGSAVNTIAIDLRNIRTVYNNAIDNDIVGAQYYPFRKFKIKHEETEYRAITVEELRNVFSYQGTQSENWARDVAKLMFLLIGISAVDLFNLEVTDDRIGYRRSKTKRLYSIKQEPEMIPLLDQFKGKEDCLNFKDQFADVAGFIRKINGQTITNKKGEKVITKRGLNTIGDNLGIPNLTSYVMRHTWATLAGELEIPKETISAALGHGAKTVTDVYIKFDRKKIDEANRKVIDYVFYEETKKQRVNPAVK